MGDYEADCPFCGHTIEMTDSSYPYTSVGCLGCGARLVMSNARKTVDQIEELPRTSYEWNTFAKRGEFGRDEVADGDVAREEILERIRENPEDWFQVKEPVVSDEQIAEVLEAGIHGDAGYSVSRKSIDPDEVRSFGVEVPA